MESPLEIAAWAGALGACASLLLFAPLGLALAATGALAAAWCVRIDRAEQAAHSAGPEGVVNR